MDCCRAVGGLVVETLVVDGLNEAVLCESFCVDLQEKGTFILELRYDIGWSVALEDAGGLVVELSDDGGGSVEPSNEGVLIVASSGNGGGFVCEPWDGGS